MTRGHQPKSSDPLGPPPVGGTAVDRRIYNVVDPAALAHVFVGAYQANVKDLDTEDATALHRAAKATKAFLKLMREPYDG